MQVEDWIGHTKALPRVSTAGDKTTTVVFADDIEIGGSNYVFSKKNCPKNIIIIAETIRISDILNVDLSAGDMSEQQLEILSAKGLPFPVLALKGEKMARDLRGGDLTLIARCIIFTRAGSLHFESKGARGLDARTIGEKGGYGFANVPGNVVEIKDLAGTDGGNGGNFARFV